MSEWTTPGEIARRVESLWNRGRILSASLSGSPLFPYAVPLRRPDSRALANRFDDVRSWIKGLEQRSKAARGFGYEIRWSERAHRQLGRNRVPSGIVVPTETDALRLIDKHVEAARFRELVSLTRARLPQLSDWLAQSPLVVIEHSQEWQRILAVLEWIRDHPRSGRYLRQVDIAGVGTKFIEDRKGVIAQLLDRVLPPDAIDTSFSGSRNFEQRYGLRLKPSLVRFRVLDPQLRIHGLSDLTVPASEFAELMMPVQRVFITENEVNGLAFPEVLESLVVFGLGYGIELLEKCEWLKDKAVFYWGDIDTHGFGILDRLRGRFAHVRSFLMDRDTLVAHRPLWVREDERYAKPLARLDPDERALFDDLRHDRLGEGVRLEQERIAFARVEQAVREIVEST